MTVIQRTLLLAAGLLSFWACAPTVGKEDRARAKTHYDIAVAQLNNGNARDALRDLLKAVELDPQLPDVHNALGLVFHRLGRIEEALQHYERCVELKPGFSEAHNNFGVLLMDIGRYDEAVLHFQRALDDMLYRTPSLAEGNMGWAYFKGGHAARGVRHLRNAVAANPRFCRGYEWLIRIGLETSKAEQAIVNCSRFERHCNQEPDVAVVMVPAYVKEIRYLCGEAHVLNGDGDSARRTFALCADSADGGFGARCAASLRSLD